VVEREVERGERDERGRARGALSGGAAPVGIQLVLVPQPDGFREHLQTETRTVRRSAHCEIEASKAKLNTQAGHRLRAPPPPHSCRGRAKGARALTTFVPSDAETKEKGRLRFAAKLKDFLVTCPRGARRS